jgi:glutamate synthase (NADPH/NADH) small chain
MTREFAGDQDRLDRLSCCQVEWTKGPDGWKIKELADTDLILDADLAILAMGFVHVVHDGLIGHLGVQLDERGNVAVRDFQTSEPWIFACGDAASGASLVVSAIDSGRQAAAAINRWLG